MNIYVETNFIFELVFQQNESQACLDIIQLCQTGSAKLIIPAYSIVEPNEKLIRQSRHRKSLQLTFEQELKEIARSSTYRSQISTMSNLSTFIVKCSEDEKVNFMQFRDSILALSEIIPLNHDILVDAVLAEKNYDLGPQDAVVYASIMDHLNQTQSQNTCFLNKNSKDFDDPDIVSNLDAFSCKMLSNFSHGLSYIKAKIVN